MLNEVTLMKIEMRIRLRSHDVGRLLGWCAMALLLTSLAGCKTADKAPLPAEAELGAEAATTTAEPAAEAEDVLVAAATTPPPEAPQPVVEPAVATEVAAPADPAMQAEPVIPAAPATPDEPLALVPEDSGGELPARRSSYMSDRGADLLDTFGIQIGGGGTLYARARLTKFGMLGAGFFKGKWLGIHSRAVGLWREKRLEGGVSVLYESEYERSEMRGNSFMQDEMFLPTSSRRPNKRGWLPIDKRVWELADDDYHWADIGLGVGLLAVAAEVHVSPFEIADFLLGIYGVDVANDDARNRPAEETPGAAEPSTPVGPTTE